MARSNGDPSRAQRTAVIARDRTCVGCGAPAMRCHIHHIRWRRHGGTTHLANLVLVCWSCHTGIHHLGWAITGSATTRFGINRRPTSGTPPATSKQPAAAGAGPPRHTS